MAQKSPKEIELENRINQLEAEIQQLKNNPFHISEGTTVKVPEAFKPLFDQAQQTVKEYFQNLTTDPTKATIEINDQRYLLIRASALSYEFLNTIKNLYSDRGEQEAFTLGKNMLFDIAHVIGMEDANNFHKQMRLVDPIEKLSAGPVHFAYTGWAFVDILAESRPSPDDNFFLIYNHPFSFEAESWLKAGVNPNSTVCIMNAGYSSGWCEESFGIPLTAVEISCKAKGDEHCTFIMAPPHKIQEHIDNYICSDSIQANDKVIYDIPSFFERKHIEEKLNKAREKAEASDRTKSAFLANVSHEIRTPLNAITGYLDLLLMDDLSEDQRNKLNIIMESSKHLQKLMDDIIDLSKIESSQIYIQKESCSLASLFDMLNNFSLSLLKRQDQNKKIKISYSIPNDIADIIITDATRLKQIMLNLLENAVKFTNKGIIAFGLSKKDARTLEFFVKDTGIGINKEKMTDIFEMFNQADNSYTREYEGVGLGLTISKKLIELLDGSMRADSIVNLGSVFYFTHPYEPDISIARDSISTPVDKAASEPVQTEIVVMLVEDNLINQQLTREILEKVGYKVITANHGKQAIELFSESQPINVIMMDIQMPFMDGLMATREIRLLEREPSRTPIVALTAHAMKGDEEKCMKAGCDAYLTKPINKDKLLSTIKQFL